MKLRRHIDDIRFEDGAWPLWRWDRNIRYLSKSLLHVRDPRTPGDRRHFAAVHRHLAESGLTRGAAEAAISAVGDMMWIRSGFDHGCMSPAVRAALASDVLLANLETPVDPMRPVPRWTYETLHYNAPPSYLNIFDGVAPRRVFSLGNNHALDQGADGLRRTRAAVLADPSRSCVGGPEARDAVADVSGPPRLAVFACTYGVNHCLSEPPPGIPVLHFGSAVHRLDDDRVAALVAAARATQPDLVIAMPHWGFEYEYWPDERVRADAYRLIELGVDIVIGSSPHVLQPIEPVSIDGADPRCPTQILRGGAPRLGVIAYSLGNFLSIMPTLACRTGAALRLGLRRAHGAWGVGSIAAMPTFCGRRVGRARWLDAGVVTVDEAPAPAQARVHAREILGAALIA